MPAIEYNTLRKTRVTDLGKIPASQLVAFLKICPKILVDQILMARLNR